MNCDIVVLGEGVEGDHCVVHYDKEAETVVLTLHNGSAVVSGAPVQHDITLNHGDTIQFGNNIFRFNYAPQVCWPTCEDRCRFSDSLPGRKAEAAAAQSRFLITQH
jgi:pSer/pThr/pTyr-binding forkhead associated (FHA) protein